jgi:hypothetical protein
MRRHARRIENHPLDASTQKTKGEAMLKTSLARGLGRLLLGASVIALALSQGVRAEDGRDHDAGQNAVEKIRTASPIKHVIIIVGENRSFDHLFATYEPKSRDERVLNLLSERIVKSDGTPNENFDRAHQFQITSAPNGGKFFISAGSAHKSLYSTLPAPDLGGVQNPRVHPFSAFRAEIQVCPRPTSSCSEPAAPVCPTAWARILASPT